MHMKDRLSSWLIVAMLKSAGSPSLVPELSACFSEFASPLAEHSILQSKKVAMFCVQRVRKSPRKFSANDSWLVDVWADN